MSERNEINFMLHEPGSLTRQSFVLGGLATMSSKYFGKMDLNRLLELLNTTNDISMQIRVFSALSAHLMFNKNADISVLIKSNAVYDKIHNLLSRGLPRSSSDALNFLSALLYDSVEESAITPPLAAYARNMTRLSGCLSAMCEMFTNCMMFHDTWKALCQCLALACSGCEINQSYCSHLIPVCIKKCCQENLDILVVLQSLILNHTRNVELFKDCKGVSIFTREILHYDKCLHLLTTFVKCSKTSTSLLQHILPILQDFIRLYGSNSQLGQKAIIILHHISSGKETVQNTTHANSIEIETAKKVVENNINVNVNQDNDLEETKVLIQNVMKEIYDWKQSELHNKNKCNYKSFTDANTTTQTPRTFFKSKQNINYKNNGSKAGKVTKNVNEIKKLIESRDHRKRDSLIGTELSFSFLEKKDFKMPHHRNIAMNSPPFHKNTRTKYINEINKPVKCHKHEKRDNFTTRTSFSHLKNRHFKVPIYKNTTTRNSHRFQNDTRTNNTIPCKTLSGATKEENTTFCMQDFRPIFESTPRLKSHTKNYTETSVNSYRTLKMQPKKNKHEKFHKLNITNEREPLKENRSETTVKLRNSETLNKENQLKIIKMRRQEAKREYQQEIVKTNCSMSARFFGAINNSCTTFVKTVKNIFGKKEISNRSSTGSDDFTDINEKRSNHAYSFLNYMQKRDAVLNTNWSRAKCIVRSGISTDANSCNTCDDTAAMKNKLTRDEFLKHTVKKLKLGINLYGCNFKKISKTMWPQERYMTPVVLNNLYRKLLLK